MNIDEILQEVRLINWFEPNGEAKDKYYVIFSIVSFEIGDIIWGKWSEFIVRCHFEQETGLDNEMMDMVKRDISWACIEKTLNVRGFFSVLLEIYKNGYFPCAYYSRRERFLC